VTTALVFARWAAALDVTLVPTDIRTRVRSSIRDAIGCALYGSGLPWTAATRRALADASPGGGATVIGTSLRLPAAHAALVNGLAVHAFELDDFNERAAGVHATASVVPAVLALAELRQVSGSDLIAAATVGQEIAVRLARCLGWSAIERGFHTPALLAAVAAGTAVGRAMGQEEEVLARTIALSALQAGGLLASKRRGMVKRLYAGRAAEIGILSALLAEAGCEAPIDIFEGPGGFCESYSGAGGYDLEALTRDLGQDLAAGGIQFKLYAACGMVHAALDALREMRALDPAIGPETVRSIEVALSASSLRSVGAVYRPDDATTAQFSVAYAVAVTLLEGDASVEQFREDLLSDARVIALAGRVRAVADAEIDARGVTGRNGARVRLQLMDGRVVERGQRVARGSLERPASEAELVGKFNTLARPTLGAERTQELAHALGRIEQLDDVSRLARLASRPDR
jgi:aconitate decarboxylase